MLSEAVLLSQYRKKVDQFIKSKQKVLILDYPGPRLNAVDILYKLVLPKKVTAITRGLILGLTAMLPASNFKNMLLRSIGINIGKDVSICFGVMFDSFYPKLITIEDGVIIGVLSLVLNHETRIDKIQIGKVHIGKQAIVGVRSTIRSGITIGDNATVAACSFVNKDVKANSIVGGIPVKPLKRSKK